MERKPIFFWKVNDEYGFMSNWYPCKFVLDGVEYHNSEQALMAKKALFFGDKDTYEKIIKTISPKECKALGRKVSPFDPLKWDHERLTTMIKILLEKFRQNPSLLERLIATGDSPLAEASPLDFIWGIGLDEKNASVIAPEEWGGKNLLGKALEKTREMLRKDLI